MNSAHLGDNQREKITYPTAAEITITSTMRMGVQSKGFLAAGVGLVLVRADLTAVRAGGTGVSGGVCGMY